MTETFEYNAPELDRWQIPSLLVGLVGIAACVVGYFVQTENDHQIAFQAYLIGFMFWWCITMGAFALLMLQHMVSGKWGLISRRIFETSAGLMWLMLIF